MSWFFFNLMIHISFGKNLHFLILSNPNYECTWKTSFGGYFNEWITTAAELHFNETATLTWTFAHVIHFLGSVSWQQANIAWECDAVRQVRWMSECPWMHRRREFSQLGFYTQQIKVNTTRRSQRWINLSLMSSECRRVDVRARKYKWEQMSVWNVGSRSENLAPHRGYGLDRSPRQPRCWHRDRSLCFMC